MDPIIIARLAHVLGFSLGMGGALTLDILTVRFLTRAITEDDLRSLSGLGQAVLAGFALLIASGAAFLVLYAWNQPAMLTNPKLWAKLSVVGVLAINSFAVHRFVLPRVARQVGRRIFEGVPTRERDLMLLIGTISGVSWMAATVLGAVRELSFKVPFNELAFAYLGALAVACTGVLVLAHLRHTPWRGVPVADPASEDGWWAGQQAGSAWCTDADEASASATS